MKTSIFSINNLQTLSKEEFAKNVLLKEISRQLEEEQENYESQRRIVCESDVPRFADPNDRATREETSAVAEALLRGMGARIEKLRAAEKRITISIQKKNLDEILSCHECGEDILRERLLSQPTTSMCFDCKEKQENATQRLRGNPPGHHMWHQHYHSA